MYQRKRYNKIVHGAGIQKITAQISELKDWLTHPRMKKSHLLAKRSKVTQYLDFLFSIIFHGTTLQDYLAFEFYNKNHKERKTYATGRRIHKFFNKVNNNSKSKLIEDKRKFAEVFSDYTGRKIFNLNLDGSNVDDAKNWLHGMDVVFAKPSNSMQGRGVTRLIVKENPEETINYCLDNSLDIMEEAIVQHPKMKALHPDSVNTIRFMTLVENDNVKLLGASLRIGNGKIVDNGGIFVSVNMETGKVDSIGHNKFVERFEKHPITNHILEGFQIPFWEEVVEMCMKAAFEIPEIKSIGWDVAITENGPLLIEGNTKWSRHVWQQPKERGLNHLLQ